MSYRKGQAGVVLEGLIFFSIEGSRFISRAVENTVILRTDARNAIFF
jgi:hypothetical protein